jgi:hypothetical protein
MLFHNAFCHTSVIFRRDSIDKRKLYYDETLHYSQDYEFWQRILQHTAAVNIELPLVAWRKNNHAVSTVFHEEQQQIATRFATKQINRLVSGQSISREEVASLRQWYNAFSPQCLKRHGQLCFQLLQILNAFKQQKGLDPLVVRCILRRWFRRILRAILCARDWKSQTFCILALMFRMDAPALIVELLLCRRGTRRIYDRYGPQVI